MKALMILGAIVGFLIGSGFGLASHSPWPEALWRACAAALVAAILSRWWSRRWLQGLREALEQRYQTPPIAPPSDKPNAKV